MSEWTLNVGQIKVMFKTTRYGTLGVKVNSAKQSFGALEYSAPLYSKKTLKSFDPDRMTEKDDFIDVRYSDPNSPKKKYRVNEINKKYYDVQMPTVYITPDKMAEMYPKTKEASVISKQNISKLNLTTVSASEGYYLLPLRDYGNMTKYKKLIEWLGEDFIITSPVRLTSTSTTTHNYAIFVDGNALIAMEVLVKAGRQLEPEI